MSDSVKLLKDIERDLIIKKKQLDTITNLNITNEELYNLKLESIALIRIKLKDLEYRKEFIISQQKKMTDEKQKIEVCIFSEFPGYKSKYVKKIMNYSNKSDMLFKLYPLLEKYEEKKFLLDYLCEEF